MSQCDQSAVGGTNRSPAGARFGRHDELLLLGLSRGDALTDSVVVLLYLALAAVVCRAWYNAAVAPGGGVDLLGGWLLPWAVSSAAIPALAVFLTRRGGMTARALGVRHEALEVQVLWGMGGAILASAAQFLWIAVERLLRDVLDSRGLAAPWWWDTGGGYGEELAGVSVGTILVVMAVAAVGEECAFRGVILPRVRRITGNWWSAVMTSSLIFGAIHHSGGLVYVVGTVLISMAFCVVFIGSGSLLSAITAHFLYNMGQYVIACWQSGSG